LEVDLGDFGCRGLSALVFAVWCGEEGGLGEAFGGGGAGGGGAGLGMGFFVRW
jgi:hypothetical protein